MTGRNQLINAHATESARAENHADRLATGMDVSSSGTAVSHEADSPDVGGYELTVKQVAMLTAATVVTAAAPGATAGAIMGALTVTALSDAFNAGYAAGSARQET